MKLGAQHNAFTLIELLVVIAIIVLLVSILVPSLNKAKDLARTAVCMNQQRALVVSTVLYCHENKNFFPYSTIDEADPSMTHTPWFELIDESMGQEARICPSGTNCKYDKTTDTLVVAPDISWNGDPLSNWIAPNGGMCKRNDKWQTNEQASLNEFKRGYGLMLVTGSQDSGGQFVGGWRPCEKIRFRHQDGKGINIGFLDSHVETWNYDDMDLYVGSHNLLDNDGFQYLPWGEGALD